MAEMRRPLSAPPARTLTTRHRGRTACRVRVAAAVALLVLPQGAWARSPAQAFLRSLLVPGWGQRHAGQAASATAFLGAEVALWGGRHALGRVADDLRDDYRAHAAAHAGAQPRGQDGRYFDDLGFYASRQEHNLWARYQDGPAAEVYPDEARTFWEWDTQASRQRYRELRNCARRADRRALYAGGVIAVNHVLAAIHAARAASGGASPRSGGTGLQPQADPDGGRLGLVLVRCF
ncbi:MAG: hypothetical protein AB1505_33260 [Candidatus Latescibacterota bacterium]